MVLPAICARSKINDVLLGHGGLPHVLPLTAVRVFGTSCPKNNKSPMQCRLRENGNISPDFAFMSVTNEFPFLKVKWENVKHTRTGRKKEQ